MSPIISFKSSQVHIPNLMTSPKKKRTENNNKNKVQFLLSMVKFPMASALKPSPSPPPPEAIYSEELHFWIPVIVFKSSL